MIAAVCILLSSAGCSGGTAQQTTSARAEITTDAPSGEMTEPAEDPGFTSDVSGLDFGQKEISFLVSGKFHSADEFDSFEASGDIVDNAVFRRNTMVEHALGIVMKVDVGGSTDHSNGDRIRKLVKSGVPDYDFVTMPGYVQTSFTLEGDFHNLLEVDNLDLSKLYWTQGFNSVMSNGIQQYVASGAYSLSLIRNMYITLYNKEIFTERGIPDLYEIAVNGEWTIGRQMELIKDTWTDRNGDGMRDEGDFYGFITGSYASVDPYWVSCNLPLLRVDTSTHEYYMEADFEKMVDVLQKVIDLVVYNDDTWNNGGTSTTDALRMTTTIDKFAEGRCAMATTTVYHIETQLTQSGFDDDYGIVPMPKYNEEQPEYYTHIQDQLSVISIVSTVDRGDLPMMGAVMDQIACFSYKEVFPAYYETALSYRYLQNNESKIMLDLIYKSLKIEGAFLYVDIFDLLGSFRERVNQSGRQASATAIKTKARNWNSKANELNAGMAELLK